MDQKVSSLIDSYRDEFLRTLQEWVRIPSVKGEPAEGYAVSSIRVTPQTITLAGSEVALASYLTDGALLYPFEQVDISGQSRTVSQLLYLNTPGNVEYISNNAVQVVVSILPEEFVNMASGTEQNP